MRKSNFGYKSNFKYKRIFNTPPRKYKEKKEKEKIKRPWELLKTDRKMPYVIIRGETYLHIRQRTELLREAFNHRYKCRKCGKRKEIQIHHLYEYCPVDEVNDWEDFIKIPWILCIDCHMDVHGIFLPEQTKDD